MRTLSFCAAAFFTCCMLALTAVAGPEPLPSGKEMKEVAPLPPPPSCDWTGFYIGMNLGGNFGHSEIKDSDFYWTHAGGGVVGAPSASSIDNSNQTWGYSHSGFTGGGQVGYNWQWKWLVLGPEFDVGYMNVDGSGIEPWSNSPPYGPNTGSTSSDFYTTFRGRIGVSLDWHGCWLLYGTAGGIGVNLETRVSDPGEDFSGSRTAFDWGYCVGGGMERKINSRWSVKVEYLYFALGDQGFTGSSPTYEPGNDFHFNGETMGHIVRAGLNFHF
jgi:outer membrane immunogenic protein